MSLRTDLLARGIGTWGIEEAAQNEEAWRQFFDERESREYAVDAGATTSLANTKIWSNYLDFDLRAVSVEINPSAAIAISGTDYATYDLLVDDGLGGVPVVFATLNTSTGNTVAAGIDRALDLTKANCLVRAGSNIYRRVTKTGGSGRQIPEHAIKFRLRPE